MRVLLLSTLYFLCWAPVSAHAQDETVKYNLNYRGQNVWVHVDDMAPLNKLSSQAKKNKTHSFGFYLPQDIKNNDLYLERLTVIRDILIKRLHTKDIKLVQEGTHNKENFIILKPL